MDYDKKYLILKDREKVNIIKIFIKNILDIKT